MVQTKTDRTTPGSGQAASRGGRQMGGGGRRLAAAFEAVSKLPVLGEARDRVVAVNGNETVSNGRLVEIVESDAGLAIAVMQAANNGNGPRGRTGGVAQAIVELSAERVAAVAAGLDTYDLLAAPGSGSERYERFRRHAVAVRIAAERVGERARLASVDELAVAALVHDVGRLVLGELYGDEFAASPEAEAGDDRVRRERRELGIDHALVGAVLVRRWGLPSAIAAAVERHHAPEAEGLAAAVRLADLIVHYANGDRVAPDAMRLTAKRLGLDEAELRELIFDFPHPGETRRRVAEPCPLSTREVDALRGLAEGKVYKQIAAELQLSTSTVRTHLHNIYGKLGAVDRAQAVLIATERGWL